MLISKIENIIIAISAILMLAWFGLGFAITNSALVNVNSLLIGVISLIVIWAISCRLHYLNKLVVEIYGKEDRRVRVAECKDNSFGALTLSAIVGLLLGVLMKGTNNVRLTDLLLAGIVQALILLFILWLVRIIKG